MTCEIFITIAIFSIQVTQKSPVLSVYVHNINKPSKVIIWTSHGQYNKQTWIMKNVYKDIRRFSFAIWLSHLHVKQKRCKIFIRAPNIGRSGTLLKFTMGSRGRAGRAVTPLSLVSFLLVKMPNARHLILIKGFQAHFKHRIFRVLNLMLMSKIFYLNWFAFDSAREKFDVWTGPHSKCQYLVLSVSWQSTCFKHFLRIPQLGVTWTKFCGFPLSYWIADLPIWTKFTCATNVMKIIHYT